MTDTTARFSEPHQVFPPMEYAVAHHILDLLGRTGDASVQAELNGLSMRYEAATPDCDAQTVNRRLRDRAEGVVQFERRFERQR